MDLCKERTIVVTYWKFLAQIGSGVVKHWMQHLTEATPGDENDKHGLLLIKTLVLTKFKFICIFKLAV